jgi:hypothetical protein
LDDPDEDGYNSPQDKKFHPESRYFPTGWSSLRFIHVRGGNAKLVPRVGASRKRLREQDFAFRNNYCANRRRLPKFNLLG